MFLQSSGGVSAKAGGVHIVVTYIIYTPNLGLVIIAFDREREQGRFRGSNEGVGGSTQGAKGSSEGVGESSEGAAREQRKNCRAVQGHSRWGA